MLYKFTLLAVLLLTVIIATTDSVHGIPTSEAITKRAGQDVVIYFRDGVKPGNEKTCDQPISGPNSALGVGIGSAQGGSEKW